MAINNHNHRSRVCTLTWRSLSIYLSGSLSSRVFTCPYISMPSSSENSQHADRVRSGSCLCGSVKYTVAGDPITFRICHCQNCRKATGSAFMTNTFFNEDVGSFHFLLRRFILIRLFTMQKVCVTEGEEMLSVYPDQATWNGSTLHRYFCSHCGSNVFLRSTDKVAVEQRIIIIALGTLDDDVDWSTLCYDYCCVACDANISYFLYSSEDRIMARTSTTFRTWH